MESCNGSERLPECVMDSSASEYAHIVYMEGVQQHSILFIRKGKSHQREQYITCG